MKPATLAIALCALPLAFTAGCSASPPPAPAPAPTVSAAAPPAPKPEPAPTASVSAAPKAEAPPVHDCGQDPEGETPVATGDVGKGKRLVRIINNGEMEVRVRLLDASMKPVFPGTLSVSPGKRGQFHVPAGIYHVRYRVQKTCDVMRGGKVKLVGRNGGFELAVKPLFRKGSGGSMKKVNEPL